MKILVTGIAGFIGFHTAKKFLEAGHNVVGLDNVNTYYDIHLKINRLHELGLDREALLNSTGKGVISYKNLKFYRQDLEDFEAMLHLFEQENIEAVCHLAAQPGIRYSLENPHLYVQSNVTGFLNVLEACRRHAVAHLVYASSSSVYGLSTQMPFSTDQHVDHPVSLYAATKKSNELMAHTYSHLYRLPTTGLRFFTVYGPWGRPDMAPHLFTEAIFNGKPIRVFNHGHLERDFTYIDDIVRGISAVMMLPPTGVGKLAEVPYQLFNIGSSMPVKLIDFIETLERITGRKAIKEFLPMQPGDLLATYAEIADFTAYTGYRPETDLNRGLNQYIEWFRGYYPTAG